MSTTSQLFPAANLQEVLSLRDEVLTYHSNLILKSHVQTLRIKYDPTQDFGLTFWMGLVPVVTGMQQQLIKLSSQINRANTVHLI